MAKRDPKKTVEPVETETDGLLTELDDEEGYVPAQPLADEDDDAAFEALLQENDAVATQDDAEEDDLQQLLDMETDELTNAAPSPADDPQAMVQEPERDEELEKLLSEDEKGALQPGQRVDFYTLVPDLEIFNKVRKRGANISVVVGTLKYYETCDRSGFSWLTILDDPQAQIEKFGQVRFAPGKIDDSRRLDIATPEFIDPEDPKAVKAWQDAVLAAADAL